MQRKQAFPWILVGLLFLSGLLAVLFQKQIIGPKETLGRKYPFRFVELQGDSTYVLDLVNLYTLVTPQKAAIPVADNWLMLLSADSLDNYYLYKPADGKSLKLKMDKNFLHVNGRLRSVVLDSSDVALNWLKGFTPEEALSVRTIELSDNLPVSGLKDLLRLTEANPNLVLLDSEDPDKFPDSTLYWQIVRKLKPEFLYSQDTFLSNYNLSGVKALWLEKSDSLLSDNFLAALKKAPSSKRLYLDGFEQAAVAQIVEILRPEELIFPNGGPSDLAFLAKQEQLRYLFTPDTISDFSFAGSLKHLEALGASIPADAKGLDQVRHLRYLRGEVYSPSLEVLLQNNPKLAYLNLADDSTVTLQPLTQLHNLVAVTLPKLDSVDLDPLKEMPGLRYLGTVANDSMKQVIQPYCPECLIYSQSNDFFGSCMGSGWLLLLLPFTLALGWAIHSRLKTLETI